MSLGPAGSLLLLAIGASVLAVACNSPSSSSSDHVGDWNGATTQGVAISFRVSPDEVLTTLSVGYNFAGCVGTQVFANLNVPTAPNVTCIPGPCSSSVSSYRAFSYASGTPGSGPSTAVNGLFLPGGRVEGVATFRDYPGCAPVASAEWTATKR